MNLIFKPRAAMGPDILGTRGKTQTSRAIVSETVPPQHVS